MNRLLTAALLGAAILGTPAVATETITLTPDQRARLAEHIKNGLRDPYSVRDAAISQAFLVMPTDVAPAVCVSFNAKNGYGAYTGRAVAGFIILSRKVIESPNAEKRCAELAYQPFPELGTD